MDWPERTHPEGSKMLRPKTTCLHHTVELRRSRGAQCQRLTRHCGFVCCQRATCGCPAIVQVMREISRASYCKRNSRHSAEAIMQAAIINSIIFRTPSFPADRPRRHRPHERPATALKGAVSPAVQSSQTQFHGVYGRCTLLRHLSGTGPGSRVIRGRVMKHA
jgi:hypothetical protein